MVHLKRNLLSVALASATMMLMAQAHAQTAPAADQSEQSDAAKKKADDAKSLDKVVVTGIRGAIDRSIETKEESTSIVEAISTEDIGKLPDSSIADAMARMPGLTAQRDHGRATQINIRGFAGDFSTTLLNGREQASTADNRGVEFDQYPAELLSSVVVYKTPDASLIGQGLSGTVDMRTVRPLDYDTRIINFGARYDQNKIGNQKETGNRYSFSYIDQFQDNTIGLSVGYAHLDSPQPGYQNEPWGYTGFRENNAVSIIGGTKFFKVDDRNKRDGLMATLQFKPNDFYEGTIDWLNSSYKKTDVQSGMQFWTEWGGGTTPTAWDITGNTVTKSSWTGIYPVISMNSNPTENRLNSLGFNNKFNLSAKWTLMVDLSMSQAKSHFQNIETTAGLVANNGTTTVDIALDPSGKFYNYHFGTDFSNLSNLVLRGVSAWGGGQDGYYKNFNVNDKLQALRAGLSRSFDDGVFSSIDFGLNYTKRTKYKTDFEGRLCLVSCSAGGTDTAPFPGQVIAFDFAGVGQLGAYDAEQAVNSGAYKILASPLSWFATKSWNVDEKVTTAYFQANIDTDVSGMGLRGNVGFQEVWTDQSGEGWNMFQGTPTGNSLTYGAKYTLFLPSLNLALEFLPNTYLRFAAGKQMARPPMDYMRGGMDVGICTTCGTQPIWSAGGGNPRLRPWLANAYDLSLEKYFTSEAGNRGYVGAAYFFKDLQSYIYTQTLPFDFAGFPLPSGPGYPTTAIGQITQPINGMGGIIRGIELTATVPLDLLWKPLNGFGIYATYSDTHSTIHPNGPGTSQPLPGLSKYVSNVTAYYERDGFSVRYSRRSRSAFLGGTRTYDGTLAFENVGSEVVQDAQVNYTFNNGMLKGLTLYLQASNIGDTPYVTYDTGDPANRPVKYFEYGKTTLIGFNYKF